MCGGGGGRTIIMFSCSSRIRKLVAMTLYSFHRRIMIKVEFSKFIEQFHKAFYDYHFSVLIYVLSL